MATVVHCKHDEFDVYIGRHCNQFPGSIFGNPFVINSEQTREDVISKHHKWLFGTIELQGVERPTISQIRELKGLRLGCWCRREGQKINDDNKCHGDTYAAIANSKSYLWYMFSHVAHKSWQERLKDEFSKSYMLKLSEMLEGVPVNRLCPIPRNIFRVFRKPFNSIRVVILGQDPYPTKGNANGLAFAYDGHDKIPGSLRNIIKELQTDVEIDNFNPNLLHWQKQGVMLLNTCLTTEICRMNYHSTWGWIEFTEVIIELLSKRKGLVFMLWGKQAQRYANIISNGNLILEAAHPSQFSCKNFFGCKHFSKANDWLDVPIEW